MSSTSNPLLKNNIIVLQRAFRKSRSRIWKAAAEHLSAARARRPAVNIGKISRLTKKGDVVVVPGKVLGAGLLNHKVVVGAFDFSQSAKQKIKKNGGSTLNLVDFVREYPEGKGVRLIGG